MLPVGIPYCGMHPYCIQARRVRLFAGNFSGMVVMGLILIVSKQMMFQCDLSVFITLACPGFVCACLCKCASLCFLRHVRTEMCLLPSPPPTIVMYLKFIIRVFVQYRKFHTCLPPAEGGSAAINDSGSLKCV